MKFYRSLVAWLPALFPLYLIRFQVGPIPTTALEVAVGLVALLGLVGGLRQKTLFKWLKTQTVRPLTKPIWPVLLFLVAATISMLIVPGETLSVTDQVVDSGRIAQGIWKGWIVMPIVYFLMVYSIDRDEAWIRQMFYALMLSGVGLSVWALVQMMTGEYLTWDGRASGPFESANYLSLYLTPLVLWAGLAFVESFIPESHSRARRVLARLFSWIRGRARWVSRPSSWGSPSSGRAGGWTDFSKWRTLAGWYTPSVWRRLIHGVVFLIMAIALWGTQSYAAFIALAAGGGVYGLLHPRIPGRYRLGALGLAVLLGAGLLFSQINTPKFQEFLEFDARSSSSVRIEVYTVATALIEKRPILGIGLGQFELQYGLSAPRVLERFPYEWVMLHPHNLLLATWLNTGLLGVISIAWLLIIALVKGGSRTPSLTRLMALSMLMVLLTHGLFDTPFWKNDLAYLWWLILVLAIRPNETD